MNLEKETKYEYKGNWLLGYKIFFEETAILIVWNRALAKRITDMLNGAFNMGKFTESMNNELAQC